MTVAQLLQSLSWLLYLLIFVLVAVRTARRPTPAHVDMLLFFGDTTAIIVLGTLVGELYAVPPIWLSDLTGALLMALAYLLLRLVADFSRVPPWLMRASELGLGASVLAILALPTPMPALPALMLVAYFVAIIAYNTWAFVQQARRTMGVTRRRMQAIAAGTVCLGLVLLLAGLETALPERAQLWTALSQVAGLVSGIAYFTGFAPPTWLRRVWQEPELRMLFTRAATLPHLASTPAIIHTLEQGATASLGASGATIGLWDAATQRLRFFYKPPPNASGEALLPPSAFGLNTDVWELDPSTQPISGRAFLEQRPLLVSDVQRADPANAVAFRAYNARAALAAPISAGDKRLGVLVVYAPQAPVFANSDLELLKLLADQAAVVLESRTLLDEAARMQAREEAMRLKEDFLSSAAHHLKTPLTGMLTQTELLLRRARSELHAEPDIRGLERILRESRRLKRVVLELLDAGQLDPTARSFNREPVDLAALARERAAVHPRCRIETDAPLIADVDRERVLRVLEHLLDNAIMYDPSGGEVLIRVWRDADRARVSVTDRGIGIPPEDLPQLFERFHRGRNVDDRRFAGLGLGLYISRQNIELHGGRIWAESRPGEGSTIHFELPLAVPAYGDAATLPESLPTSA